MALVTVYDDEKNLVTIGAMARRLKVGVQWLRDEAEAGRIPHLKAGKQILFHPPAVEAALLERAKQGGAAK